MRDVKTKIFLIFITSVAPLTIHLSTIIKFNLKSKGLVYYFGYSLIETKKGIKYAFETRTDSLGINGIRPIEQIL